MSWDELPATITTYLTAHEARDVATAITAFTADAVVTDEGHTYRGRDNIGDWLRNAASGFTFTTEFVGATRESAAHRRRATPGRGLPGWDRRLALPFHHGWCIDQPTGDRALSR